MTPVRISETGDWTAVAYTVTGTTHRDHGSANQDAVDIDPSASGAGTVILAVADGHGSKNYPRSGTGSRLAVSVFIELARDFCDIAQREPLSVVKGLADDGVPRELVKGWIERVRDDLATTPVPEPDPGQSLESPDWSQPHAVSQPDTKSIAEESLYKPSPHDLQREGGMVARLGSRPQGGRPHESPESADRIVPDDDIDRPSVPRLKDMVSGPEDVSIYGSTLLGAVITPHLLVCWQLGDGDIVLVSEDGSIERPLKSDESLLGTETDSLVQPEAWRRMRVHWSPITGAPPALVLMSTDGLANSYASEEDFEAFPRDVHHLLCTVGPEAVVGQVEGWLQGATNFSGDDVTLAAAWRTAALMPLQPDKE